MFAALTSARCPASRTSPSGSSVARARSSGCKRYRRRRSHSRPRAVLPEMSRKRRPTAATAHRWRGDRSRCSSRPLSPDQAGQTTRPISSASVRKYGALPLCAFVPVETSIPPSTELALIPPSRSTAAAIAVEVVLPCVPQMAMPRDPSMIGAQHLAAPDDPDAAFPGAAVFRIALVDGRADDDRICAVEILAAMADGNRGACLPECAMIGESFESEPVIRWPRASKTRAIALMPIPPMPTKCKVSSMLKRRSFAAQAPLSAQEWP